jgi:hypothetical protein
MTATVEVLRSGTGADTGRTVLMGISPDMLPVFWPLVAPLLAQALEHADGRYALEDVRDALLARDMQLWIAVDPRSLAIEAACVTEIVAYPREKRCGVVFCAGRRTERWLRHLDEIEDWARGQGCHALELQGRPGWERLLRDWEKTHVLLRKRL